MQFIDTTTAPLLCEARTHQRVPVYQCPVPAGFPSPAEDYLGPAA